MILLFVLSVYVGCGRDSKKPQLTVEELQVAEKILLFLGKSERALDKGNFQAALTFADSVETYGPNLAGVHFLRGLIFSRLNRFEEAQASYEKVLSINPDYEQTWYNLGENAYQQELYRPSLNYFERELEVKQRPEIYVSIGLAYANLYMADSAEWAYLQAVSLDTAHAPAYMYLGEFYKNEGQTELALRHLRLALQLDPNEITYQYLLGSLLYQVGEFEDAVTNLRLAAAHRPWHHPSHYKLGMALNQLGRKKEGQMHLATADTLQQLQVKISRLQRESQLRPENVNNWIRLAHAFHLIGRADKALQNYQIAHMLDPQDLMLHDNVAYLHLLVGDTTGAISQYQAILRKDSTRSYTWFNLGLIHAAKGTFRPARRAWQKAVMYNPEDTTAKRLLEKLPDEKFIKYITE